MLVKYSNLTLIEYCCIFILAFITVSSSIFIFYFDKNYNNPFINTIFLKAFGMIALLAVSIFVFEEKYKWTQILGVVIVLLGLYLTTLK
jgi:drug/metabolite transporter (DMT)-like permease